jgi:hypothetical protein
MVAVDLVEPQAASATHITKPIIIIVTLAKLTNYSWLDRKVL